MMRKLLTLLETVPIPIIVFVGCVASYFQYQDQVRSTVYLTNRSTYSEKKLVVSEVVRRRVESGEATQDVWFVIGEVDGSVVEVDATALGVRRPWTMSFFGWSPFSTIDQAEAEFRNRFPIGSEIRVLHSATETSWVNFATSQTLSLQRYQSFGPVNLILLLLKANWLILFGVFLAIYRRLNQRARE